MQTSYLIPCHSHIELVHIVGIEQHNSKIPVEERFRPQLYHHVRTTDQYQTTALVRPALHCSCCRCGHQQCQTDLGQWQSLLDWSQCTSSRRLSPSNHQTYPSTQHAFNKPRFRKSVAIMSGALHSDQNVYSVRESTKFMVG